ncbi:MAG TPA: DUF3418 domain-containing protein [Pseudonocardiaceae bacterium]|nr:DUF3418 domain-containing protein [Pseudonocardiaceae bacterium]
MAQPSGQLAAPESGLLRFPGSWLGDSATEIVSGRHFGSWWRKVSTSKPDLLDFDPALLITGDDVSAQDYPDSWPLGTLRLDLSTSSSPTPTA